MNFLKKSIANLGAIALINFPLYAHAQDPAYTYIYSYVSPVLNLKAGVTLNSNQPVTAVQTSQHNVFNVTQYSPGKTNNAGVAQSGQSDLAMLRQIGRFNNEIVIQEGPHTRAYVTQIANDTAFISTAP